MMNSNSNFKWMTFTAAFGSDLFGNEHLKRNNLLCSNGKGISHTRQHWGTCNLEEWGRSSVACPSLTILLMRCLVSVWLWHEFRLWDLSSPGLWRCRRRWQRPAGNWTGYELPDEGGGKAILEAWVAAVNCATETNLCLICLKRWEIPWWHLVMSPKVAEVWCSGDHFSQVP